MTPQVAAAPQWGKDAPQPAAALVDVDGTALRGRAWRAQRVPAMDGGEAEGARERNPSQSSVLTAARFNSGNTRAAPILSCAAA